MSKMSKSKQLVAAKQRYETADKFLMDALRSEYPPGTLVIRHGKTRLTVVSGPIGWASHRAEFFVEGPSGKRYFVYASGLERA